MSRLHVPKPAYCAFRTHAWARWGAGLGLHSSREKGFWSRLSWILHRSLARWIPTP